MTRELLGLLITYLQRYGTLGMGAFDGRDGCCWVEGWKEGGGKARAWGIADVKFYRTRRYLMDGKGLGFFLAVQASETLIIIGEASVYVHTWESSLIHILVPWDVLGHGRPWQPKTQGSIEKQSS